jgi:hypothetical protein
MVVESTLGLAQGDQLTIRFHDGRIGVVVGPDAPQRPSRAKKVPTPGQGSLL